MAIKTFKRIERKYVISESQKRELEKVLIQHMNYDKFCQNGKNYWIQNIYYDTINNSLIEKSIAKPKYKAKVRVRHYVGNDIYFVEWKQKTNSIVSKRRISLTKNEFDNFFVKQKLPIRQNYLDNQIINEFNYFLSKNAIFPALYLSYNRIAMFDKQDSEFRLTMDNKIYGSRTNFQWDQKNPDIKILDDGRYILEIKLNHNFPLWLASTLSKLKIFHQSFSKYGEEYKNYLRSKNYGCL